MGWLEDKYSSMLSPRLRNFKKRGKHFNFSCPLCGDSKKSKSKARGWILERTKGVRYYCHNCGASLKFAEFLKRIDVNLYYDYVKEQFLEKRPEVKEQKQQPVVHDKPRFDIKLKRVSQLPADHPVKLYVQKRMIPSDLHYKIYLAPKFKRWVNSLDPTKYPNAVSDEPRLILPLLDENGVFFGLQGRSFRKGADDKYITILLDDRKPKLYGLDTVDFTDTVYVVEGPIDSLFVKNCIASCGGRLDTNVGGDPVLIYDNEPRNVETVKKLDRAIKDGYRVVIWPSEIKEKDINDMIINGFTVKDVHNIIEENTYRGLTAELKLLEWKKT